VATRRYSTGYKLLDDVDIGAAVVNLLSWLLLFFVIRLSLFEKWVQN
jgi:hypothetical protein